MYFAQIVKITEKQIVLSYRRGYNTLGYRKDVHLIYVNIDKNVHESIEKDKLYKGDYVIVYGRITPRCVPLQLQECGLATVTVVHNPIIELIKHKTNKEA